jgi:hypothetical protein
MVGEWEGELGAEIWGFVPRRLNFLTWAALLIFHGKNLVISKKPSWAGFLSAGVCVDLMATVIQGTSVRPSLNVSITSPFLSNIKAVLIPLTGTYTNFCKEDEGALC